MPFAQSSTPAKAGAITLAALIVLAAGCASKPDVRHDQDPAVDLNSYKTFAFFEQAPVDKARYTTLLGARLKRATREQLERQDYVYSEANPDLRVNLRLVVLEKQEIRSSPSGRAFYGYRGWSNDAIETVDYRQGTLAVDLVDARRNALVWHGVAEGRLDSKAMEQPGPAIEAAVGEIFAHFPGTTPKSR